MTRRTPPLRAFLFWGARDDCRLLWNVNEQLNEVDRSSRAAAMLVIALVTGFSVVFGSAMEGSLLSRLPVRHVRHVPFQTGRNREQLSPTTGVRERQRLARLNDMNEES